MTFGSQIHFDQLRLIRSPNIGPVSYRQLMSRFGSAKAALEALPDLVRRRDGKQMVLANEAAVAREFQITRAFGARHVFAGDTDYPLLLSHLDNAPPVMCVKGDVALLARPAVALWAHAMRPQALASLRGNWPLNLAKWGCLLYLA